MMTGFCETRACERAWRIAAKMSRVAPLTRAAPCPARTLTTPTPAIAQMIATITSSSMSVKARRFASCHLFMGG